MITLTARQSIILKCNMQASVLLGNYEFYYGAGLFCKINGIHVKEDVLPKELKALILPELEHFLSEDKREKYLAKLLLNYEEKEEYDEQMKELLLWGLHEEKMWSVH